MRLARGSGTRIRRSARRSLCWSGVLRGCCVLRGVTRDAGECGATPKRGVEAACGAAGQAAVAAAVAAGALAAAKRARRATRRLRVARRAARRVARLGPLARPLVRPSSGACASEMEREKRAFASFLARQRDLAEVRP